MNDLILVQRIIDAVVNETGLSVEKIQSADRSRYVVDQRDTIIYLARKHTRLTLADLAEKFFQRRHPSIISAVQREEHRLKISQPVKGRASRQAFHDRIMKKVLNEKV